MPLTAGLSLLTLTIKSEMKLKAERATRSTCHQISDFGKSATMAFEMLKLDIVVMEVGMGWRLDATVMIPDGVVVSALASINLIARGSSGMRRQDCGSSEMVGIARRGNRSCWGG